MAEKRPSRWLFLFLGAGLFLAPVLSQRTVAQVLYGSLVGTVTDPTGAVVPGAIVTATNPRTGFSREARTNDAGYYTLPNLLEGNYDLVVKATGFKNFTQTNIRVDINAVNRSDVTLQVGAVTETVTVEASAAVLQTDTAEVKSTLEAKAMENLPLTAYRNYQELINLVPGATPARFQNAVTDSPARALTTNVNGQNRNANNTRLDGAANIFIWLPHHTAYVAPSETIETVSISTNSFDAEQGMTGGAAIAVATKSGTNDFHGSLFALHEDSGLRTFLWEENRSGRTDKPHGVRNIDGGTIGGPIKKDKLFFFAGWEGLFERGSRSVTFSVPQPDLRTGDFNRLLGDQILVGGAPVLVPTTEGGLVPLQEGMIFDPFSGDVNGRNRAVFSDAGVLNVIPQARLNSPTTQLLGLVPFPNRPGEVNNFFNIGVQKVNRNNVDGKVNWNRRDNHQLWFKYSIMDALVTGDFGLGAAGGTCLCDGGIGEGSTRVQVATVGQTYTVSSNFLIDATLGWTRMDQTVEGPDLGTNFGSDVLGIPGTNGPDPRESGMPDFIINNADTGFSTLGNPEGWSPIFRNDQSYTFNANASWIKGAHDLRFGFDFVHHLLNHWQPELGRGPRGGFTFGTGVAALNSDLDGDGDADIPSMENDFTALAAFMLGTPSASGKSSQFIKMNSFENQYGVFVRDRWRVTPKLTLTLGVRWELYPTRTRSDGLGIESYDPTTNEVLVGGRGSIPRDAGVGYSKKLFAPRVGIAYRLTDSTVIRTGYGLTYNPHPFSRPLRGFYPLTVASDFAGVNGFQPVTTDPNYVAAGIPNAPLGPTVGIPAICCPDISTGRITLPLPALHGFPQANNELNRGYSQSWNFIIERKLPGEFVTSVGYVGSNFVNGFAFLDINASQTIGTGNDGRPLFGPFGRTSGTWLWDGHTNGNYHSLQVAVNRRFTRGLLIKSAYTYSRALNMVDDDGWANLSWNAASAIGRNLAPAGHNIPHIFRFGYVYELPFGKDKAMATSGAAAAILGGWQHNGIFSAFQGRQLTVTASGTSLNMPGNQQTADQVKDTVETIGCVGSEPGCTFFDTSAFVPVSEVRFGTTGRNTIRGPGVVNMDLSLFRTFQLTERLGLQFRAEAFNVSNTPHFSNPNTNASSSAFGQITGTDSGGTNSASVRSRQFRFGLRLSW